MRRNVTVYRQGRPVTMTARLRLLEKQLAPYETDAQRHSRELLTYWLAESKNGASLLVDFEDMRERHGATGMLRTRAGRELTMALLDDLIDQLVPTNVAG